jgi:hypothetical protein
MKKLLLYAPLLLIGVIFSSFDTNSCSFITAYQGADIRLDWRVPEESEVIGYDIFRKKADETTFTKINSVAVNNSGTYTFLDDNLYKTSDGAQSIAYRLTIKTNQSSYNLYSSIQHSPTAVQRSWGSIKSMFK